MCVCLFIYSQWLFISLPVFLDIETHPFCTLWLQVVVKIDLMKMPVITKRMCMIPHPKKHCLWLLKIFIASNRFFVGLDLESTLPSKCDVNIHMGVRWIFGWRGRGEGSVVPSYYIAFVTAGVGGAFKGHWHFLDFKI